jgi:hypothetical protein
MIVDCISFGIELDVLELRLSLLDDVVDKFVIVEAPKTFSGLPKDRVLEENRERFARWDDKIIAVELDDLPPPVPSRWLPVVVHRNAILRGLEAAGASDDDVVVVADVDEIPFRASIDEAARRIRAGQPSVSFELATSRYFANWVDSSELIVVTKAFRYGDLKSPHHQRMFEPAASVIHDAGRHISTLLTPSQQAEKIAMVAHAERDNSRDASPVHLERCRRFAVEFLGGSMLEQVEPTDEVLESLARLRPDLIARDPLPPTSLRERYLAITRVRRAFPASSGIIDWVDRHAENAAIGEIAKLVAPVVLFGRRVRTIPERRRRAAERKAYFGSVTCTPDQLCRVCVGDSI